MPRLPRSPPPRPCRSRPPQAASDAPPSIASSAPMSPSAPRPRCCAACARASLPVPTTSSLAPPARGLRCLCRRPRASRLPAKRGNRRIHSSDTVQQLGAFGLEQCYDILHRHSRFASLPPTSIRGIAYRHSTVAADMSAEGRSWVSLAPCQRPGPGTPNPGPAPHRGPQTPIAALRPPSRPSDPHRLTSELRYEPGGFATGSGRTVNPTENSGLLVSVPPPYVVGYLHHMTGCVGY